MTIDPFEQTLIDRFRDDHARWEGVKTAAYVCPAGYLSIGIGHNCEAVPVRGVKKVGDVVSMETVNALYAQDCDRTFDDLDKYLPWWRTLDAPRAAVLFDMSFNMGIGFPASGKHPGRGLRSFEGTLALIHRGQYAEAATRMEGSKWARQVHKRAVAMIRQMRTGEWQV